MVRACFPNVWVLVVNERSFHIARVGVGANLAYRPGSIMRDFLRGMFRGCLKRGELYVDGDIWFTA